MKLACVQSDVALNDPLENSRVACAELERLASQGVNLAVFPEAFLTGYAVEQESEARAIAIPKTHEALHRIQAICADRSVYACVGFAEENDDKLYNTTALFGPNGVVGYYRKSHLPFLGFDRFAVAGTDLPVFDTELGRIGIVICFDLRIPETVRVLAVKGAEVVLLPTNWPTGAEMTAEHFAITRAAENRVILATCNRVGSEGGFQFIGQSKIIDVDGKVCVAAGSGAAPIIADVDPKSSRVKRRVVIPGVYETDTFATRQPDLYRVLSD
jgi:5-aminopentanamidase